jgi:hypothetical protein
MRFLSAKQDLADHCTIPSPGASLAASPGRHPEADSTVCTNDLHAVPTGTEAWFFR